MTSRHATSALVVVAHGTADAHGRRTVLRLREQVARLLPGVRVVDAYVDVQQPRLPDVVESLAREGIRTVIVPVLLSAGYHMDVDVAGAAQLSPRVTATPPLGPHPVLAEVAADRLRQAGAPPDAPVVLAAAGSSRPEAADAVRAVAATLQTLHDGPVIAGFASAATPSVADAVDMLANDVGADAGAAGGPWVASYLLGRGFFHTTIARRFGPRVTEPLGADPRIARLVRDRFLADIETPTGRNVSTRPASAA